MASSLSTVRHGGPVSRASASSLSKGQLLHLEKSKQVSLLAHRRVSVSDDDFDDDYEGEEELMDTVVGVDPRVGAYEASIPAAASHLLAQHANAHTLEDLADELRERLFGARPGHAPQPYSTQAPSNSKLKIIRQQAEHNYLLKRKCARLSREASEAAADSEKQRLAHEELQELLSALSLEWQHLSLENQRLMDAQFRDRERRLAAIVKRMRMRAAHAALLTWYDNTMTMKQYRADRANERLRREYEKACKRAERLEQMVRRRKGNMLQRIQLAVAAKALKAWRDHTREELELREQMNWSELEDRVNVAEKTEKETVRKLDDELSRRKFAEENLRYAENRNRYLKKDLKEAKLEHEEQKRVLSKKIDETQKVVSQLKVEAEEREREMVQFRGDMARVAARKARNIARGKAFAAWRMVTNSAHLNSLVESMREKAVRHFWNRHYLPAWNAWKAATREGPHRRIAQLERDLAMTKDDLAASQERAERIGQIALRVAARNFTRLMKSSMLAALLHWRQVVQEELKLGRMKRIIASVRDKYIRYMRNAALIAPWARWKQFTKESKARRAQDREAALLQQIRQLKTQLAALERMEAHRLKSMRKAAERAFRRFKYHTQWRAFSAWKWVVDILHYTAEMRHRVEAKLGALRSIVKPLEDEVGGLRLFKEAVLSKDHASVIIRAGGGFESLESFLSKIQSKLASVKLKEGDEDSAKFYGLHGMMQGIGHAAMNAMEERGRSYSPVRHPDPSASSLYHVSSTEDTASTMGPADVPPLRINTSSSGSVSNWNEEGTPRGGRTRWRMTSSNQNTLPWKNNSPTKKSRPASASAVRRDTSNAPLSMGMRSRSRPLRRVNHDPNDTRRVVSVAYEPPPERPSRAGGPLERRIDEAWERIGGLGAAGRNRRRLIDNPGEHEVAWNGTTRRTVRVSLRDSDLEAMAQRSAAADARARRRADELTDELVQDREEERMLEHSASVAETRRC